MEYLDYYNENGDFLGKESREFFKNLFLFDFFYKIRYNK